MLLENYKNLKQLDRIEFLLRLDNLKKKFEYISLWFMIYMSFILTFGLILGLLIYIIVKDLSIFRFLLSLNKAFLLIIGGCIIYDLLTYLSKRKALLNLDEEFLK